MTCVANQRWLPYGDTVEIGVRNASHTAIPRDGGEKTKKDKEKLSLPLLGLTARHVRFRKHRSERVPQGLGTFPLEGRQGGAECGGQKVPQPPPKRRAWSQADVW
jgi:hypothetical protein